MIVVDDLSDGRKFQNMADCDIADCLDKEDFQQRMFADQGLPQIDCIYHEGAYQRYTQADNSPLRAAGYDKEMR